MTNTATWITSAACTGRTDLFFAPANERGAKRALREAQALLLCASCVVRDDCREAGAAEEYGIWGGVSVEVRS